MRPPPLTRSLLTITTPFDARISSAAVLTGFARGVWAEEIIRRTTRAGFSNRDSCALRLSCSVASARASWIMTWGQREAAGDGRAPRRQAALRSPCPPRLVEITNGRCRFAAIRMPQPRLDQSVGAPRIDGLRRTNRLSKTSACRPKLTERSIIEMF